MKRYEFNYSKDFKCIAGECKHNCCVGWEIAVDKRTRQKYSNIEKDDTRFFGAISNHKFNMNKGLRCPFLDGDNLCHLIKNYGEKSLCSTCKTHPRFKNFFKGETETGLGLYCEEAGKVILSSKQKMKRVLVKTDNKPTSITPFEKKIFAFRNKVVKILQNRKFSISERLNAIKPLYDIDFNQKCVSEWLEFFSTLEKLPVNEYSFNKIVAKNFCDMDENFALPFEQLLCYLAFRHLSSAIDQVDLRIRLAFIVLSFNMINLIFNEGEKSLDTLIESARFYTSEIECSDENLYKILDEIESLIRFYLIK